ncbi:metallophosphoesterase [Massilia horti]|uniref:Metallophosphoesterase n=1 Tax=Massilia horti TaxID=2562153 RepID=A0A4Y9T099_9BURK|nr:metallophosphoesterase [Massilia horti]TFW32146.1 metallophosphoesterase [Massilia horti]
MTRFRHTSRALLLGAGAALSGCAFLQPAHPPEAAYVVLGEGGAPIARVLTTAASCPSITLDHRELPMTVRAPLAPIPERGAAHPNGVPPSSPVLTCELPIPAGTRQASVARQALPLPHASFDRIVVIGDTGCRLKGREAQDCNDPQAFPFATVAASAARFKPDLIVHVGDYHYREDPCPAGRAGCAGSPWGYGWDAWNADFFAPGAALLKAAPWVMARGNHESCVRGGQGFWRFLDPRPLVPGRDCDAPANDHVGDYGDPYAVPLGGDAQLIVFDSSNTSYKGFQPGDPRIANYADTWRKVAALAQQAQYNIAVDHHPLFGFGATRNAKTGEAQLFGGDAGLLQSFGALDAGILPPSISMLLSGHVHLWEQVSFSSSHPTQFVSGFSGTAEDIVPLPESVPSGVTPAPGAVVEHMSSWIDGFGFMTMERSGANAWLVKVWDRDGNERNSCQVTGRKSVCAVRQVK